MLRQDNVQPVEDSVLMFLNGGHEEPAQIIFWIL